MNGEELARLQHYYYKLDAAQGSTICLSSEQARDFANLEKKRAQHESMPLGLRLAILACVVLLTLYAPIELTKVITQWNTIFPGEAARAGLWREIAYIWGSYGLAVVTMLTVTVWRRQ